MLAVPIKFDTVYSFFFKLHIIKTNIGSKSRLGLIKN